MSGLKRLLALALVAFVFIPLGAASGPLKLATQAPTDSMWDKELKSLGATWKKATSDRVTLSVFADGSQGDESTSIRKMRPGVDALQAALLTAGLATATLAAATVRHIRRTREIPVSDFRPVAVFDRATREYRMSPRIVTFSPAMRPFFSRIVNASSNACVGCSCAPSPALITLAFRNLARKCGAPAAL